MSRHERRPWGGGSAGTGLRVARAPHAPTEHSIYLLHPLLLAVRPGWGRPWRCLPVGKSPLSGTLSLGREQLRQWLHTVFTCETLSLLVWVCPSRIPPVAVVGASWASPRSLSSIGGVRDFLYLQDAGG